MRKENKMRRIKKKRLFPAAVLMLSLLLFSDTNMHTSAAEQTEETSGIYIVETAAAAEQEILLLKGSGGQTPWEGETSEAASTEESEVPQESGETIEETEPEETEEETEPEETEEETEPEETEEETEPEETEDKTAFYFIEKEFNGHLGDNELKLHFYIGDDLLANDESGTIKIGISLGEGLSHSSDISMSMPAGGADRNIFTLQFTLKGEKSGTYNITLTYSGKSASIPVNIEKSSTEPWLELQESFIFNIGEDSQIHALYHSPENTVPNIYISNSSPSVFSLEKSADVFLLYEENGIYTFSVSIPGKCLKEGESTVTMKIGEAKGSATVTSHANTLSLDKSELLFKDKTTARLTASKDGVKWESTDSSVATVDANGLVTAVDYGECEIIAAAGTEKASCKVNVAYWLIRSSGISAVSKPEGVLLSWEKADGASGYIIGSIHNGNPFRQLTYVPGGDKVSYLDTAASDVIYSYYWVIPIKRVKDESAADQNTYKTVRGLAAGYAYGLKILPGVSDFKSQSAAGGVILSWNKQEAADGYVVKVRRGNTGNATVLARTKENGFKDTEAPADVMSFYWVYPYKQYGDAIRPGEISSYVFGKTLE